MSISRSVIHLYAAFDHVPGELRLTGSAYVVGSALQLTSGAGHETGSCIVDIPIANIESKIVTIDFDVRIVCEHGCGDGLTVVLAPYQSILLGVPGDVNTKCSSGLVCVQQSEYGDYFSISDGTSLVQNVGTPAIVDTFVGHMSVGLDAIGKRLYATLSGSGLSQPVHLMTPSSALSSLSSSQTYGIVIQGHSGAFSAIHTIDNLVVNITSSFPTSSPTIAPTSYPTIDSNAPGMLYCN